MAQGRRVNNHLEVLVDNSQMVEAAIRRLANTTVMVGIPSDDEEKYNETGGEPKGKNTRTDTTDTNNATIGYIHETGAPASNIPARPWLSPGVRNSRTAWQRYMVQAGKLAFAGKLDAAEHAWHAAGMKAVGGVKDRIESNIPPPLSQVTVDRRRQRSRGSTYRRKAMVASDTTALIDTAQMINSVSYAIRHRGKK